MALWKVQAGKYGEQEAIILEHNIVAIGWNDVGDLSKVSSRDELERHFKETYPEATPNSAANQIGQIWAFKARIKVNDWIAVPLKNRSAIAVGVVQSGYEYRQDLGDNVHHTRRVKWLRQDIPRTAFDQDLLYSFGAFMTVCQITRNDAESRVRAIVEGKLATLPSPEPSEAIDVAQPSDVAQLARDEIQRHISRKFRGHKLAQLVDAILRAQGYVSRLSPGGPDRGVDILAGRGPMGFDPPRLCVQVKSSDSPCDVSVLRELRGTMKVHNAEHGLLVSWGGFKQSVFTEAATAYFDIRLWDQGELLNQIFTNYERLGEPIQAELSLKRIWALAIEEESE